VDRAHLRPVRPRRLLCLDRHPAQGPPARRGLPRSLRLRDGHLPRRPAPRPAQPV